MNRTSNNKGKKKSIQIYQNRLPLIRGDIVLVLITNSCKSSKLFNDNIVQLAL